MNFLRLLKQKGNFSSGGRSNTRGTTGHDGETKCFNDSEIGLIKRHLQEGSADARSRAVKRGYQLHPRLAAKA